MRKEVKGKSKRPKVKGPSTSSRGGGSFTSLTAQDYQICVTVIEARHLAGINMDPVVCVQVRLIIFHLRYFVIDWDKNLTLLLNI